MQETQLIDACLQADRSAQKELYERYGPGLMGVCLRYLNNREDAEEAAHDAFVKVFRGLEKFRAGSSLKTWITRIGIHTSIDFLRKRKNIMMVEHIAVELQEHPEEDLEAEFELKTETALHILGQLSVNQQIIVNLCLVDELSHREVATLLNISEEASRAKLSRARKSLLKITEMELKKNEKSGQAAQDVS